MFRLIPATQKDLGANAVLTENSFALAMEVNGEKVACGVFSKDEELITLEDLFVLPFHEGNGYGRSFISELSKTASQNLVGQLTWPVTKFILHVAPFKVTALTDHKPNPVSA